MGREEARAKGLDFFFFFLIATSRIRFFFGGGVNLRWEMLTNVLRSFVNNSFKKVFMKKKF